MTELRVRPEDLDAAAAGVDGVARDVAALRTQLRAQGNPDTGRGDTRCALDAALARLITGLDRTIDGAAVHADDLTAAAERYRQTEARVVRLR